MNKRWRCLDCLYEFETDWIPSRLVSCPKCKSKNVVRIDELRGKGFGVRRRRGICGRFRL